MKLIDYSTLSREELEQIIGQNLLAFYMVGKSLYEIRERKLYKDSHPSFKDYCNDVWKLSKSYTYNVLLSTECIDNLQTAGCNQLPCSEYQARSLAAFPENIQIFLWDFLCNSFDPSEITGNQIKKAGEQILRPDKRATLQYNDKVFHLKHMSPEDQSFYGKVFGYSFETIFEDYYPNFFIIDGKINKQLDLPNENVQFFVYKKENEHVLSVSSIKPANKLPFVDILKEKKITSFKMNQHVAELVYDDSNQFEDTSLSFIHEKMITKISISDYQDGTLVIDNSNSLLKLFNAYKRLVFVYEYPISVFKIYGEKLEISQRYNLLLDKISSLDITDLPEKDIDLAVDYLDKIFKLIEK